MTTVLATLPLRAREAWLASGARAPLVAARWLFRREYLVTARGVHGAPPVVSPPEVRWMRVDDPAALSTLGRHSLLTPVGIRRRLAEGQECWAGWIGRELVHWRWETSREAYLPYLGKTFRPCPGDRCVLDVFTAPRYRGRGLHTAATLLAIERARDEGHSRLIGFVAWWNGPARRVVEVKTGRPVVGGVGYWRAGPWRRYFTRGLVRLDDDGAVIVGFPGARPTGGRPQAGRHQWLAT